MKSYSTVEKRARSRILLYELIDLQYLLLLELQKKIELVESSEFKFVFKDIFITKLEYDMLLDEILKNKQKLKKYIHEI